MDRALKASADAIYERARSESGQTARDEKKTFVETRASRSTKYMPLSGPELQAVAAIYGRHIERCIRARFDSYQDVYKKTTTTPTDNDLREILKSVKDAAEQETKHTATVLQQFAQANGLSTGRGTGIDPAAMLTGNSSRTHDRVVQDWHVWRTDVALQAEALQKSQKPAPKSWESVPGLWQVITAAAVLMLGFAGNAIYAGDVRVTFWLFSIGLLLLTTRFITWDQIKNLPFRDGAIAAALVSAVFLLVLALNLAEKRAPQPAPPPLITMQISPSSLPISSPAHSVTSVLQLHPFIGLTGDRDGLLKIANDTGREACWPTKEELATAEANRRETIYRVEITKSLRSHS